MDRILVLFTCFNRIEKTKRCVEALCNETGIVCDFVVVDDSSRDGTAEYLEKLPYVHLIAGNGNLFYSKAMHQAIDKAKDILNHEHYDYILMVNDDVDFFPDVVKKMIDYLSGEQAILVGATCDAEGKLTYGGIQQMSSWRPKFKKVMSGENRISCDTMNANCVLIPKNTFSSLDNIDEVYWHGLGDFDYGLEAKKRGCMLYASNFFVGICEDDHKIEGTWKDASLTRKERYLLKEKALGNPTAIWFYFLKKHYGIFTAMLYVVNDYAKILIKK